MNAVRPFGEHSDSLLTVLLMGVFAAVSVSVVGCSSSSRPLPPPSPQNPLPECPATPNCVRISETYPVSADTLFANANRALESLGPSELRVSPDSLRASAVYRVALVFKDDVDLTVESREDGSMLHVRSASRVGQNDLGVNRRRVQRLLSALRSER